MDGRKRAIIIGTDFAVLYTAIRDGIDIPDEWPDEIPDEWLDDLSGYELSAKISTAVRGRSVVASTSPGTGQLTIRRIDASHFAVNIPASATEGMQEGEIVLTVELRHKETGVIMKGERRTIPLVRVRDMRRK